MKTRVVGVVGVVGVFALVLAGCTAGNPSANIVAQVDADGVVDLSTAVPGPWTRVCIVGPYSDPATEGRRLAFRWPADAESTITGSDAVSLLVFTEGERVTTWVEHPRHSGDFSNVSGRCFPRGRTRFEHDARPENGWPGLFPQTRP